ncbi:MAG: hypothetical protein GY750_06775 [Lentisphaerae bacterium]|jgi:hypothetical protein|nr:hypothetical protein [Lentisphaerota bacterium]
MTKETNQPNFVGRIPSEQPPVGNDRALAEFLTRQAILTNAIIKNLEDRIKHLENP